MHTVQVLRSVYQASDARMHAYSIITARGSDGSIVFSIVAAFSLSKR